MSIQIVKAKKAGRRPISVGIRTIIQDNGEKARIYLVSSNSPNLGEDLLYAMNKGIQAARRENKRLLGSYSGLPQNPKESE